MDGYLSKLRGLASSAANAVQSKIGREYDADFSTNGTGTSGLWTLYATRRRATGDAATIWLFDKQGFFDRAINRQTLGPAGQLRILELLRTEASQLTRLRHPQILRVVEPLEETRGALMFVTEQVAASLEDTVQRGGTVRVLDEEYELDELEIQKGLLQVARGLAFLHDDVGVVHGNLRPSSVLVDGRGDWKLAGLGFARRMGSRTPGFEHDYAVPAQAQQALAFMAPEHVSGEGTAAAADDVFALACLAAALHNHGVSPLDCDEEAASYRRALQGMRAAGGLARGGMPEALAALVHSVLTAPGDRRPTLAQVQKSAYFDNVLVAALRFLDGLAAQAAEQKVAFMQALGRLVGQFPARVLRRKLLPLLLEQTSDHALLPYTLPNVLAVAERLDAAEFGPLAAPALRSIVALSDLPTRAALVLLGGLRLLQTRVAAQAFAEDMLPFLYGALGSGDVAVQEQALMAAADVAAGLAPDEVRERLLPAVQRVYGRATILAVKVRALECVHVMLGPVGRAAVVERVLPMLRRTRSREPAVVMAMAAAYERIADGAMDAAGVAKHVLPELWALLVDARLDAGQFAVLEALIARLSDAVLGDCRAKAQERGRLEEVRRGVERTQDAGGAGGTMGLEALLRAAASPPAAAGPPDGEWQWDAPAGEVDGGLGSLEPRAEPEPRPAARVASRLRTTAAQSPGGGRLGAMRLGAAASAAGTTASFGFSLPPPPGASKKPAEQKQAPPLADDFAALSFGQKTQQPSAGKPAGAGVSRGQKHRGGKASELGDFDPFA